MTTPLAQCIRNARAAVGLTQEQLAQRIGLKAQALYRWERGRPAPSKRNLSKLLAAISVLDGAAATRLKAQLDGLRGARGEGSARAAPPAPLPPRMAPAHVVELVVSALADELDQTPRRARGALLRACKALQGEELSLSDVERELEAALLGRTSLIPSGVSFQPET
jgi:transcriptional regulator with XRE-family HTH domain